MIQFAEKYGVSERTVRNYCTNGKIEGAFLTGKTWNIPADAVLPKRGKATGKVSALLKVLREQTMFFMSEVWSLQPQITSRKRR